MFRACHTPARNSEDFVAWYVTGKDSAFFFFYLYKEHLHGQIKLGKIAGEFSWTSKVGDLLCVGVWVRSVS